MSILCLEEQTVFFWVHSHPSPIINLLKKWKVKHYLSLKRQAFESKDFWKIHPSFDISDSELHSILTNSPQLLFPIKHRFPPLFLKFQANI